MPCYKPLQGWRAASVNVSGKRGVVFNVSEGFADLPVEVPCGQCAGCRLERSRQWAVRLMHEKQSHLFSWFLTLTYRDADLPLGGSLRMRDVQLFLKRVRKHCSGVRIRYFYCGEYGDKTDRPHYHMILFGPDFPDRRVVNRREKGDLYESDQLTALWGHGNVWIGAVTPETCAYTARYIMKKMTGEKAKEHYEVIVGATGEIVDRVPEFVCMSRKPGIGKEWYDQFKSDVYPSDNVVVRGKVAKPPRYYDRQLEAEDPEASKAIKYRRTRRALQFAEDNTPARLRTRENVAKARLKFFSQRDKI